MEGALTIFLAGILLSPANAPPPKGFKCRETLRVAWLNKPPYSEMGHDDHNKTSNHGIVEDILKDSIRQCCIVEPLCVHTAFIQSQSHVQDFAADDATRFTAEFILPIQLEAGTKRLLQYPFIPVVDSPGFGVFIMPAQDALTVLISTVVSIIPLLVITVIVVCVAGTLFWMIEAFSLAATGQPPLRFNPGVFDAIWWAFVTMSTVGYGDVIPKTKPGRVCNVLWIFSGVCLCAMVISGITDGLVTGLAPKETDLRNQDVSVLRGSPEYSYVLKKQANPIEFDEVKHLAEALYNRSVPIALLDVRVASYYEKEMQRFVLDRIIEFMTSTGVVVLPNAHKLSSCIRQYMVDSQQEILNRISTQLRVVGFRPPEPPKQLMDAKSKSFRYFLISIIGLLTFLTCFGVFKQWVDKKVKRRKEARNNNNRLSYDLAMEGTSFYSVEPLRDSDNEYEMELLQHLRRAFNRDLSDFLKTIENNIPPSH